MPILVRIQGVAGAATAAQCPENWSFGTWWRAVTPAEDQPPTQEQADTLANDCYFAATANLLTDDMSFGNNVFITGARVYYYAPVFPRADAVRIGVHDTAGANRTGIEYAPLQNSLVVTLKNRADHLHKPRFGRFYLPSNTLALDATSKISFGQATAAATAAGSMLDVMDAALSSDLDHDWRLVIQSWSKPTLPWTAVDTIAVGHVIDTQRRRRNQQDESYTEIAY